MSRLFAVWIIIFFVLVSVRATALGVQPPVHSGTRVVVIDIAKVMRNHTWLNDRLAELKEQEQTHHALVQQQRRELRARMARLEKQDIGSADRKTRQQECETALTELEALCEQKRTEFAKRSAQFHWKVYKSVQELAKNIAVQHDIDLVLNYDSSDADSDDPEQIMRRIEDRVVWQSQLNITWLVIEAVKEVKTPPRPVRRYQPGTKVVYAPTSPRDAAQSYILPRKAGDRILGITNRIKQRSKPVRLAPYTSAPVGSFTVGDSWYHLLREGVIVDPAFQSAIDPVLRKLVDIQKENDWKMDDQVFQSWIKELEESDPSGPLQPRIRN